MNGFTKALDSKRTTPLLLDGALGSLLPQESQDHALWSTHTVITQPDLIKDIHKQYIASGSDIISTSTYQTSEIGLSKYFPDLDFAEVVQKSIILAKEAIIESKPEKDVFIAASIGPYGASLANGAEYTGNYGNVTGNDLVKFHEQRLNLLVDNTDVDLLAIETIPNILEIKVLIELAKKTNKPFYLSLSVSEESLADGTSLEDIAPLVQNIPNLIAVGVNCLSLEKSLDWLKKLKSTGIKGVVYPNSGELWDPLLRKFVDNPEPTMTWNKYIQKLIEIENVLIVGGCCRTNPQTIHEMRTALDGI